MPIVKHFSQLCVAWSRRGRRDTLSPSAAVRQWCSASHMGGAVGSPRGGQGSHRMPGTMERLLKGDPSTTRVLYARYTNVRCVRSTMRMPRVSLKMSEVRSLHTSASWGSFVSSTVDIVMEICCALHNFRVRLTPWQPMV